MKTLLALIALLLAFGFTFASEYERLKESLKEVAKECVLVDKFTTDNRAYLNLYCSTYDECGEIKREQKKVIIKLDEKTWKRFPDWIKLLG